MTDIDNKIKEIFSRVDIAANGQTSTSCWSEADINLSAPDGMDYWDWIEQATNDALLSSKELTNQVAELRDALLDIKHALGANPNESSEALFDKCANAFKIAEDAQKALKDGEL